jgi:16S rRNA (guanine966-N2)-methyltransferase
VDSPPRSKQVRPTTGMMRESVFSRFQFDLPNSRFLDLFAGSGIMGLEALSRGAAFVLAIEADEDQCRMMRKNFDKIGLSEADIKISSNDVRRLLSQPCRKEAFDFVFMDPPYGFKDLPLIAESCMQNGWVKSDGVVIVEHGFRDPDLAGFTRKNYGESSLSIRLMREPQG